MSKAGNPDTGVQNTGTVPPHTGARTWWWAGSLSGAAFLMATSAIGPGFLTQTSLFTQELLASFGFVILISILLDLGAQLNIWRIVTMSGNRAQDIANRVVPGLGILLAALIAFGGLVFNIGDMAGSGLGLNVMFGIDPKTGAVISCLVALSIFWYRQAGHMIDNVAKILGLVMILLTLYISISSRPPLGEALYRTIWPEKIDMIKIVTLVGGTVGGYISFAGAHRLVDAGITGPGSTSLVTRSAISGILLTSLMRFLLFLAALGVVTQGVTLSAGNPAASVFESAAGWIGYKFFGVVIWCAAITSVVGASYISISFWKTLVPAVKRNEKYFISMFIVVATLLFLSLGNPVKLLVMAGAINGMILPLALAVILLAANSKRVMGDYKHPVSWLAAGWVVVMLMGWMSLRSISQLFQ